MNLKRIVSLLLALLLALGCAGASAEKARGIADSEDAAFHERHLREHIGSEQLRGTGNYLKVRAECRMNAKVLGHLEQADRFLLLDVSDGLALVQVTDSAPSSPDSRPGLTGWVDLRYLDCPCSWGQYENGAFSGYSDYEDVLAQARRELLLNDGEGSIITEPLYEEPNTVGYLYRDVNGDGVPELLVMSSPYASEPIIWAAFTLENGVPYQLLSGWYRSRYFLLNDNSFYYEGSDGAAYSVRARYVLEGARCVYTGGYASTDYFSGGTEKWGWFRSPDGSYTTDPALLVSESEAESWTRDMESRIAFPDDWRPLLESAGE